MPRGSTSWRDIGEQLYGPGKKIEEVPMAQWQGHISDVTNEVITDPGELVTMVVLDHPLIEDPVKLDISGTEAASLDIEVGDFVILELVASGADKHERVVMKQAAFDAMFTSARVDEVLSGADKYRPDIPATAEVPPETPKRRGRPRGSGTAEAKNYKALPLAGIPHKGKVSAAEAAVVVENFEEVNRNRVAAGHLAIDLTNPEDVERYSLEALVVKPSPIPRPFTS